MVNRRLMLTLAAFTATPYLSKAQRRERVTDAVPMTIAAVPAYVAADRGFWADEGLDVSMQFFPSGRQALDALLGGTAEIMSVSETPPMHAVIQGQRVVWVGTTTKHREVKLTVRSDRIATPADIRGKRIATAPGTNSDYYLYQWLSQNGLHPQDVQILSMQPPAMVQAFIQGSIDAMAAWEPHNYAAYSRVPTMSRSLPNDLYEGRHCIIMNQAYAVRNKVTVERMIRGFVAAERYISAEPDAAKQITVKATGVDPETLNALWSEYEFRVQLDDKLLDILALQANWAISTSRTSVRTPSFRDFMYPDAMREVLPDRLGSRFR